MRHCTKHPMKLAIRHPGFIVAIACWSTLAVAGPGEVLARCAGEAAAATPGNALWRTECGSCHVACPPGLLTAPGWRRLMSGLERHFGADASLDDGTRLEIQAFPERHAARSGRNASPDGRITHTAWFRQEHGEVPASAWRGGPVSSAARCEACHAGAAEGRYGEGEIRLPGGWRAER
jgi:Dihaem cytochrome c